MGGRGAGSGITSKNKYNNQISNLNYFKALSSIQNEVKQQALEDGYGVLQLPKMNGGTVTLYANGNRWEDRPNQYNKNKDKVLKISLEEMESRFQGKNGQWDFRGEKERVNKLVDAIDTRRGQTSLTNLSLAIAREERTVSSLISAVESGREDGDTAALLTMRRQLRQAQAKLRQKRGM